MEECKEYLFEYANDVEFRNICRSYDFINGELSPDKQEVFNRDLLFDKELKSSFHHVLIELWNEEILNERFIQLFLQLYMTDNAFKQNYRLNCEIDRLGREFVNESDFLNGKY